MLRIVKILKRWSKKVIAEITIFLVIGRVKHIGEMPKL